MPLNLHFRASNSLVGHLSAVRTHMPSSAQMESRATSPPPSIQSASADEQMEAFEADIDELMRKIANKPACLVQWQERYDGEMKGIRAEMRAISSAINEIQLNIKEILERVHELGAALSGDEEAKREIQRRHRLSKNRDELVKMLTGGQSSTWETYVQSMPEGAHPSAARDLLLQAAKDAIPIYEAKTQLPPRTSPWMTIVKGKAREDKREKEASKTEHARKAGEAVEAQRILKLLRDEELLQSFE